MKLTKAALPFTMTVVPSSTVGSRPPANSVDVHERVVVARFVPVIVIQEFCIMPDAKLAPFATPDIVGLVGEELMDKVKFLETETLVGEAESVTLMTTELLPDAAGVPTMTPVTGVMVKLVGSPVADQVYVPVPPVPATVAE